MTELRVLRGGEQRPLVLLLHGLGATADVWAGLTALLGDTSWAAPDLPGHGRSAPLDSYTFARVADSVAHLVYPGGTVVVGHSFGGVVGLHLADLPGVRAVVGLGIKVAWTDEELGRAATLAGKEAVVFPAREQAMARCLKVAGLDGLVSDLDAGVAETDGGWRLALDNRAFGVGEPGVAGLIAATGTPVVLARGEHDSMVSDAQLRGVARATCATVSLPGLGHNAHVEGPTALLSLLPTGQ